MPGEHAQHYRESSEKQQQQAAAQAQALLVKARGPIAVESEQLPKVLRATAEQSHICKPGKKTSGYSQQLATSAGHAERIASSLPRDRDLSWFT